MGLARIYTKEQAALQLALCIWPANYVHRLHDCYYLISMCIYPTNPAYQH